MQYPTKTALVLREDLLVWQKANVAAFLAGGLARSFPELGGEAYRDAAGRLYSPLLREPVFIFGADAHGIRRTYERAMTRDLTIAIYTSALFATNNDADNRAVVAACDAASLDLVGLGLHAERKSVDKVLSGLKFLKD